jgi:hypothetical protein
MHCVWIGWQSLPGDAEASHFFSQLYWQKLDGMMIFSVFVHLVFVFVSISLQLMPSISP